MQQPQFASPMMGSTLPMAPSYNGYSPVPPQGLFSDMANGVRAIFDLGNSSLKRLSYIVILFTLSIVVFGVYSVFAAILTDLLSAKALRDYMISYIVVNCTLGLILTITTFVTVAMANGSTNTDRRTGKETKYNLMATTSANLWAFVAAALSICLVTTILGVALLVENDRTTDATPGSWLFLMRMGNFIAHFVFSVVALAFSVPAVYSFRNPHTLAK